MLLVRSRPREGGDWTGLLRRRRHDELDALLDDADQRTLQELPLDGAARATLFDVAAGALAQHAGNSAAVPAAPGVLEQRVFCSPLMVVIAAYLAVHGDTVQATRSELLEELIGHEDAYWQRSSDPGPPGRVLRRRVVALATLSTAGDEDRAAELLRLLPDLRSVDSQRVRELARWAADLYPEAGGYWGAVGPDLVGEHLVATTLPAMPDVLGGVLSSGDAHAAVQPLDVYARAAPDHPALAQVLSDVLCQELSSLCERAVKQAATETDLQLMLGDSTLAATLTRAIRVIAVGARRPGRDRRSATATPRPHSRAPCGARSDRPRRSALPAPGGR